MLPRTRRVTFLALSVLSTAVEHHFRDENGNYGITNFALGRLFGTLYVRSERSRSPTVSTSATLGKWPGAILG
jgi:sterol desaturase/sphingolipid hydroxylase (fatty acid hydroxylase superfamily)